MNVREGAECCASCAGALPPDARFCPHCGTPRQTAAPAPAMAERKLVTVVFCDLVDSTVLSDTLDPETLRTVTLRYFARTREQIEVFGGTVEKFIGDAVMAVFGVPAMHEDDARRALAAALGMREAVAGLSAELERVLGVRLRVRIGVNTGPAVTGRDIGESQALVSGETVNVAARLEQHARPGEILIGPTTRLAAGPTARTEPVGPLHLKGKAAPVTGHRLLGVGGDAPELLRRFDVPFVGRVSELRELDLALDGVVRGHGAALVTVYGEPGIGKTRLVHAWRDRLTHAVAFGAGRCRPYGDHGSLTPLATAVRDLLDTVHLTESNRPTAALAMLSAGLLQDGTPTTSMNATCAALARVLAAIAAGRPAVLVIDDCHWASDTLLALLDRLVDELASSRVLVLRLARLDLLERQPARSGGHSRVLTLTGLSAGEARTMATALADVTAHLAAWPGDVLESAAGNPFYLEQLLTAVGAGETSDVPPTLHGLLGARIDALDRPARAALDLAAVVGREFTSHQVEALARAGPEGGPGGPLHPSASDRPVGAALARLGTLRLVEPADDTAFRFNSSLIHEVTYHSIAKRTRADRHERAADLLAGDAPIAEHLERCYRYRTELGMADAHTDTVRRRAGDLLARAGSQVLARSDLDRAATLLGRAVDLLVPGEAGWTTATWQLGEVRIATGRGEEGRSLLRSVLADPADPVEGAHARLALAVADPVGAPGAAAAVARAVLPVFEAAGDDLGRARSRIRMAQEKQLRGRHAEASALLETGLEHAVRADAEPERAVALGAIGVSLWRGPTPVPAAVARCQALLAEHGGLRPTVRLTLNCPLAVLLALMEKGEAARRRLAEAQRLAAELGYAEGAVVIPVFAAAVESSTGRLEPALGLLDQAIAAARRIDAGGLLGAALRQSARLLLDHDRPADAADRLATDTAVTSGTVSANTVSMNAASTNTDSAATSASTNTVPTHTADLPRADAADLAGLRARLAAGDRDHGAALAFAAAAVAAAAATDSPIVQAVAALDQAIVLRQAGRDPAAAAARARRRFERKGHLPGVRQAAYFEGRERR